jgi:alpha-mannosidase/mannosylglycerate hydrolase
MICKKLADHYGCPAEFAGLDQLPELLADKDLPVKKGELNELTREIVQHSMLITFTLSSRYDLKKANDTCQHEMEKYALPAAALLSPELKSGAKPVPPGYLRTAYRYLLLNHAHDSICGCSIDSVHRDMHYRFRQVQSLAGGVFNLYLTNENQKLKTLSDGTYLLCLFNPLPYGFEKTIKAGIAFDPADPCRENSRIMYEQRNQFKMQDSSGKELKYTVNSMHRGKPDVCTVTFTAALNPLGMTYIRVIPQNKPIRYQDSLCTGPFSAENAFISLDMNSDVTITIK